MAASASLNHDLLQFLKKQKSPIPANELENKLGLRRDDLFLDLDRLMHAGYEIEFHPYLGVRLLDIPNRMLKHEVIEALNTKVVGKRVTVFDTCASTSDEAWRAVETGSFEDGDLFIAEHQTAGRGRQGRVWDSPDSSGLYLSFVAQIKIPADRALYLTAAASLAVANTIETILHLPPEIKWPNDVLIGGRKVAGIMVEARSTSPDTFVVGVGINVNQSADAIPTALRGYATSLRIERKSGPIHRVRLVQPLIFYLDSVFAQVRKKRWDRIEKAWLEYVDTRKRQVTVKVAGEDVQGQLLSVSLEKGVELETSTGTKQRYKSEHVQSVRSQGMAESPIL